MLKTLAIMHRDQKASSEAFHCQCIQDWLDLGGPCPM